MSRKHYRGAVILGFALLLVSGGLQALAAQEQATQEVPLGATATEALVEYIGESYPATEELDGFEELNPVDEEGLEMLAGKYAEGETIFEKYARLPGCTKTGCPGGIDHMAAGAGTRNMGFGTIRLRGVPATARPVTAFLYWSTIYASGSPIPTNPTVYFRGFMRTGSIVSSTSFPCWGPGTLVTYRAWVFPFILPAINGDYPVTGLASGLTTGQDPWVPFNTVFPLSQGTSLVVLYTDKNIPRGTFVQIHHLTGTQFFGTMTFNHTLYRPITVDAIKHTRIGADGQVGGGMPNISSMTDERTYFGRDQFSLVQIRGNGCAPNGSEDSDLNGTDGEPMNQLWDTHTMDVTGITGPTPGYTVQYQQPTGPIRDCVLPRIHVITAR